MYPSLMPTSVPKYNTYRVIAMIWLDCFRQGAQKSEQNIPMLLLINNNLHFILNIRKIV